MPVNESSATVRPYAGRDPAFAAALARAESAAEPKPIKPDYVARTRSGMVERSDGAIFQPGLHMDPEVFNGLPLID